MHGALISIQDSIIKPKLGLLEFAKQCGSVSHACMVKVYSRDNGQPASHFRHR
jgi:hypothetical protein